MCYYFRYFLYTKITAKTIIRAAIPCSPRLLRRLIKLFVTCDPKNATLGPNNISAITETPNKRTPISRNLFKKPVILEIQLFIYTLSKKSLTNLSL